MNKNLIDSFIILFPFIFCSCEQKTKSDIEILKLDKSIIEIIKHHSDEHIREKRGDKDFFYCDSYTNSKDSMETLIMSDSGENVVGLRIAKNDMIIFAAEYFPNGQIKGKLPKRIDGNLNGPAKYYYPDGRVRISGNYTNGMRSGLWKNYDSTGYLISTEDFGKGKREDVIN